MFITKTETMRVPLKVFAQPEDIEQKCIERMKQISSLPFVEHHVALMPDGHFSEFGASIGAVIATKDVVLPCVVGVDISCGVCAVKTSLTEIDKETLKNIMGEIRKVIPVGFNKHKEEDVNLTSEQLEGIDNYLDSKYEII